MNKIINKYKLREMEISDIDHVVVLYNDLAYYVQKETSDPYFDFEHLNAKGIEEYLKGTLDKKTIKTYIAEFDGDIVGFITGEIISCFLPLSSTKEIGYINGCFIKENHRKKGITKALMNKIEDFFKDSKIRFVELHYILGNNVAEKTWTRLGFSTFRFQMRKLLLD